MWNFDIEALSPPVSIPLLLLTPIQTKVDHSDQRVPCGRALAQRIKVVWHLDVDSSHPGVEEGPKGSVVRR
ncbi:hypothetical protein MTR_5g065040 [Medicago truncatula]|uniref:Uncharacterized protein n=1 Tax=Medicago truncatula TaxID=3880 RepID=G7KAK4_MEDTR|nr:hypothetical protein MTR_5g065040 [Medicago truncatula]